MNLVEQTNPFDILMKDEINRWENPLTGKLEPVNPPEISVGPYTGGTGDGFGEIGTYKGGATVEPLDFLNNFLDERLFAKGKSPFSTPHWDKQDDIRKYLDNDQRLIESLIRRGKIKV